MILFPPQGYLLHLLAPLLPPSPSATVPLSRDTLAHQRNEVIKFLTQFEPSIGERCISPTFTAMTSDGRTILTLDNPGLEVDGKGRKGDRERVALAVFTKAGPTKVEISMRKDVEELLRDTQKSSTRGEKL